MDAKNVAQLNFIKDEFKKDLFKKFKIAKIPVIHYDTLLIDDHLTFKVVINNKELLLTFDLSNNKIYTNDYMRFDNIDKAISLFITKIFIEILRKIEEKIDSNINPKYITFYEFGRFNLYRKINFEKVYSKLEL